MEWLDFNFIYFYLLYWARNAFGWMEVPIESWLWQKLVTILKIIFMRLCTLYLPDLFPLSEKISVNTSLSLVVNTSIFCFSNSEDTPNPISVQAKKFTLLLSRCENPCADTLVFPKEAMSIFSPCFFLWKDYLHICL